jgi:hydrogenase maturation protein HypF
MAGNVSVLKLELIFYKIITFNTIANNIVILFTLMSDYTSNIIALTIHIKGLVQGVGFRPFVYRLASEYHLHGWVVNGTDGVTVKVEGMAAYMAPFVENLRNKAPVISQIDEMVIDQDLPEGLSGFYILASQDLTDETSEISPDIAVCADCLSDMESQSHRKNYPFINCTNCGPRFSIISDFPYDRSNTTMATFAMCEICHDEYSGISDRRFHAQPVACKNCGPHYTLHSNGGKIDDINEILARTADLIENGAVIAIKGVGGYHLMCNALNEKGVADLRAMKKREGKPFAVVFRDIDSVKQFAEVSDAEASVLNSWRRPVVLLKNTRPLAKGISKGLGTVGAFLPYMPFHYQLFRVLKTPCMVLTSGNFAQEPVLITNESALEAFSSKTSAVITYNREIYNRTDDSVVRVISGKEQIVRRSRGYAPAPVRLEFNVDGILAAGAELSNCFCLGKGNRAYLSQHIGDLKNYETLEFYEESLRRFKQIFRINPKLIAADLHPDYLSTRYANKSGLPVIGVQHHHAHIVSCMAEHGIDGPVIGLAFDGTGYGTDGHIWGSEFMVCDYRYFERKLHFDYMPMPGGDKASEEPWRMGLALLWQTFGEQIFEMDLPLLKAVKPSLARDVVRSVQKGINCPLTSGSGRLFDAVAAISGICTHSLFHAEAPMRLESAVDCETDEYYDFTIDGTIEFYAAIKQICEDLSSGVSTGVIAARFHNTITEASAQAAKQISESTGITTVVLSGGTFQNKYLTETLEKKLLKNNLAVYMHSKVPCNDGGIALGQLVIAANAVDCRL